MFGVTILGSNSALPAFDRHPSCQVVTIGDHQFMVDCGEGSQMQMSRYKIRQSRISAIFISHLHGDHYFGLIGLINTMSLLNREQPLQLFGPAPLLEIIRVQLAAADNVLSYHLEFHALTEPGILLEDFKYAVSCFRVFHRIECWGFLFREKKNPRKVEAFLAEAQGVPSTYYNRLKKGEDYISPDGKFVPNASVTVPNKPALSYAYCADTLYSPSLIPVIQGVDLLYHEATYLSDQQEKAEARYHSTAGQAAMLAREAGVGHLLIGHFSSKYENPEPLLDEARAGFPATDLAIEGCTFRVLPHDTDLPD